jgi:hypothetical protein
VRVRNRQRYLRLASKIVAAMREDYGLTLSIDDRLSECGVLRLVRHGALDLRFSLFPIDRIVEFVLVLHVGRQAAEAHRQVARIPLKKMHVSLVLAAVGAMPWLFEHARRVLLDAHVVDDGVVVT